MIREAYIICKIFGNLDNETKEKWEFLFERGTTKFFEYGIINHFEDRGVLYINSATINDTQFNNKMLVYIHRLVKNKEDVVLASSIRGIRTLLDNGFEYDYVNELYIRGKEYYKQLAASRRGGRS
jgi:hypothetical protein